jgi:hypothetical protein
MLDKLVIAAEQNPDSQFASEPLLVPPSEADAGSQAKLFTLDKNYLLKEAQKQLKDFLLKELVAHTKETYLHNFNPLGLMDETCTCLSAAETSETEFLEHFYHELSGIYRYKHGENQLEILFDGTTHFDKYLRDWKRSFHRWTHDFLKHKHFLRAVIEGAFLKPDPVTQHLVQVRLKLMLENYFGLRVYVYHGIRKIKAA